MNDGRGSERRVVIRGKDSNGEDVIFAMEVTPDGYVAVHRKGVDTAVLWDPRSLSRVIDELRQLQAVALRGVRWTGIH